MRMKKQSSIIRIDKNKKPPKTGAEKNIVFLQEYPHSKLAQEAPRIAPCGGVRSRVGKVPSSLSQSRVGRFSGEFLK